MQAQLIIIIIIFIVLVQLKEFNHTGFKIHIVHMIHYKHSIKNTDYTVKTHLHWGRDKFPSVSSSVHPRAQACSAVFAGSLSDQEAGCHA
jgi:hypothetical protein